MDEQERPYHDVAGLFPLMQGEEFEQLKADIAANGLREAIWLHPDGSIIDGRNRHRACIETDTPPRFRTWQGDGSLVAFVVSLNLHRRHLSSSQRAMIARRILPMLEAENPHGGDRRSDGFQGGNLSTLNGKNRDHAGKMFGVSGRYVGEADYIAEAAPDLVESVEVGDLSIPQAKREITRRQKQDPPPLPDDKYRVIYADPPWHYGNSGVIGETDHYGHVHRHYPSMTISELCDLGPDIRDMATKDAVLFLWVTSPLLEECFDVIRAWGFKYKTSFVWDKVGHNFGHYNSVRHEFLLICTRGSCTPDKPKLHDSVQSIEKSKVHSEKPEAFRQIIDDIYPHGRRIELFARAEAEGWDMWGNE